MDAKISIDDRLSAVPETMLIPLWARAVETQREDSIIKDIRALDILSRIAYDFSRFEKAWMSQVGVCIRTMLLDRAVRNYLSNHPNAVVVNLGCGLDTRVERLSTESHALWYDLDLPEAIGLRRVFFRETARNRFIEKSFLDHSWMDDIATDGGTVLFIAEGLFMYFSEDEVRGLFRRLADRFPGSEILFEMLSPLLVGRSARHDALGRTGGKAEFRWGLGNARKMEDWAPGIVFLEEWNYFDFHRDRWRFMKWPAKIPAFKNGFNNRIVHMAFRG